MNFPKETKNRFINKETELNLKNAGTTIIVDTETGVQYLYVDYNMKPGGITPLIDRDGNPLLDPNYKNKTEE
ncbi:MAG: DUF6440 family protein [Oscillospiraceae bacterium]|nr:DUF6440 family protein [Oscillospiraceae bacterium]